MGLYGRNKKWWMDLRIDGIRKRIATGTENKKLAERIHARILTEIEEGRWFEAHDKKRTLSEMITRYETHHTDTKDYYQRSRDKSIFKHLKSYFGEDATLQDVENTVGGYEQWRRGHNRKPATIVKELGLLRRMFTVARKQWNWKVSNPVSGIELPRVRNERVRYLSDEEHKMLFEVLDASKEKWLRPLVVVALDTGLRLSNLCNLTWADVNLFGRMVTISSEKTKNDDYLGIPLTERAQETLRTLQKVKAMSGYVFHSEGQPLYPVKIQRAFKAALKAAGIVNFHFHDLRHCYCSLLRQRGVDLHTIATLAGHRDLRMTKRYAHLSVDSLRDAVAKLEDTKWTQQKEQTTATAV